MVSPKSLDIATRSVEMSTLRYIRERVVWLDAWAIDNNVDSTSAAQDMIMRYNARWPERVTREAIAVYATRAWNVAAGWANDQIPDPLDPDVSAQRARFVQRIVQEITVSMKRLPLYYVDHLLDSPVTAPPQAVTIAKKSDGLLDASQIARRAARRLAARVITWTRAQATKTVWGAYGATEFVWRTQRDSRVREAHRELEGTTWPLSSGHPEEGYPGDPYNCRCESQPILPSGF